MRLLKWYAVLLVVLTIIYGVLSFTDSSTAYSSVEEENKILPKGQWVEALSGEWEINYKLENPHEILDITGIIEFRKDSTYKQVLICKTYGGAYGTTKAKVHQDHLKETGKMIKVGKYFMSDIAPKLYNSSDTLLMLGGQCDYYPIEPQNSKYDVCHSTLYVLNLLGNLDTNQSLHKLNRFTKKRIVMEVNLPEVIEPIIVRLKKLGGTD